MTVIYHCVLVHYTSALELELLMEFKHYQKIYQFLTMSMYLLL